MPSTFSATIMNRVPATVIQLEGELDVATVPALTRLVHGAMNAGATHLILDLRNLGFIDSTGLGALARLHHRAVQMGAVLILCNPSMTATKLFELTGLDMVLNIQHT